MQASSTASHRLVHKPGIEEVQIAARYSITLIYAAQVPRDPVAIYKLVSTPLITSTGELSSHSEVACSRESNSVSPWQWRCLPSRPFPLGQGRAGCQSLSDPTSEVAIQCGLIVLGAPHAKGERVCST